MSAENFYLINEEVRADKPYHYEACGLDNIYLLNGYEVIEHEGEEHVSVKNMEELHQEIGRYLVCERKTLGGKDIRFLRSTMSMTQTQLARALGTTAQTLARWEKQAVVIPDTAEKLLRGRISNMTGRGGFRPRAAACCSAWRCGGDARTMRHGLET